MHVLVIDDEADLVDAYEIWLTKMGHTCTKETDPIKGNSDIVSHCLSDTYQLIITDLHMPKQQGDELIENLRNMEYKDTPTPILVITGFLKEEVLNKLAHHQGLYFLEKPVNRARFEQKIKKIFA